MKVNITDQEILLELHQKVIQAYFEADVDGWLTMKTAEYIW